jgi:hypothetical protein
MGKAKINQARIRAVALVAVLVAAAFALTGSAGATGKYSDKTGDGGATFDITGAQVASDASGQITFRIDVASMAAGDIIGLFVDSDANPLTGDVRAGGADYLFLMVPSERAYDPEHWNGSDWDDNFTRLSLRVALTSTAVLVMINRSELGNTGQVNFWATSLKGDGGPGNIDVAPDDGLWNYDLSASGPDIRQVLVQTMPAAGPRVGKTFSVKVSGINLPQTNVPTAVQPDSWKCTAKLGGRTLAGSGTGGCTFRIPKKKSKGRQLVVTVSVTYQGATKSIQLPFKVRK